MNTTQIIKNAFPKAYESEIINLGDIAVIAGYENIKTPEKYLEKYLDNLNPVNPATFFKNGLPQCTKDRNRSFTDLYAIVRARFPRLKIEKFAYILCMYQLNERKSLYFSYCGEVHKIVMRCHKSYGDKIESKWKLDGKFKDVKEGQYVKDTDRSRRLDDYRHLGDGVTIKKITGLANSYLSQLKNK